MRWEITGGALGKIGKHSGLTTLLRNAQSMRCLLEASSLQSLDITLVIETLLKQWQHVRIGLIFSLQITS